MQAAPSRISGQLISITGSTVTGKTIDFRINLVGPIESVQTDANGFFAGDVSAPLSGITISDQSAQTKVAPIGSLYVLPGASIDLGSVTLDYSTIRKPQARVKGPIHLVESPQGARGNPGMIVALLIACSGPVQDYCDRNTLTLIGADGSTVEPLAQSSQIGVSEPIISQDGSAAGWLSNEPFCCTSYPISVHLVIYTSTKLLKAFTGDGRAIFKWKFVSSGRRVAFYQDFPHGTPVQHYELRDVYSSRLISKWNGELTRKGAGLDKRTLIVLVSNYLANRVVLDQPNDARFANLQRV